MNYKTLSRTDKLLVLNLAAQAVRLNPSLTIGNERITNLSEIAALYEEVADELSKHLAL